MCDIQAWLQEEVNSQIRMIMQVHDKLVFEIPKAQVEKASKQIKQLMEQATKLAVPLIVDVGTGDNWEVAH